MAKRLTVCTMLLASGLAAVAPSEAQSSADAVIKDANQQILNEGKLEVIGDFFSPDYVNHSSTEGGPGMIRGFVEALRAAFPDLRVEVEILLQQGDTVAWRRTHEGTFQADLGELKATGQKVVWHAVVLSRISGGKIIEEWGLDDLNSKARE